MELNLGIMQVGASVGGSKGRESERMQTLKITDAVLFDGVYRALAEDDKLVEIKDATVETRRKLSIRTFVKLEGTASPPVLESWMEQLRLTLDLLEKYSQLVGKMPNALSPRSNKKGRGVSQQRPDTQMLKQFEAIVDLLQDYIRLTREDPGREYIRISPVTRQYNIWCGLLPEFVLAPYADFTSEVIVVGQVERLLDKEEIWKLVDLSKFGNQDTALALLSALNSIPLGLKEITENDLHAKYPDFFVRPLAIYR